MYHKDKKTVSNGFALNKGEEKTSGKTEQWHHLAYLYLGQLQLIVLERILLKVKGEWRKRDQEGGGHLSLKKKKKKGECNE